MGLQDGIAGWDCRMGLQDGIARWDCRMGLQDGMLGRGKVLVRNLYFCYT